jgi:5-methylthioadenosine/S-adenosylhomocysteine deaminase
VPLSMHVAQSRSEVKRLQSWYGKGSIEYLADRNLLGPDLIAAHCVFISESEALLLAQSKTWVAYLPMINAKRGYAAPIPSLLSYGANIAIGADNMTGDMVMATRSATIIARVISGSSIILPPREALRMATIEGARALGLGNELGSIELGKLADLIIVDLQKPHLYPLHSDPVATYLHWGLASDIETVIIDGRIVLESGQPVRVEQPKVLEAAQRAAEDCWGTFQAG